MPPPGVVLSVFNEFTASMNARSLAFSSSERLSPMAWFHRRLTKLTAARLEQRYIDFAITIRARAGEWLHSTYPSSRHAPHHQ